ncbi:MAG TPA: hypothetical protein PKC14_02080, partial [Candidatus Absconditabacterales bacterium]|nr:hypothetical protein [Candidatus Absconditabacterales bacterium]
LGNLDELKNYTSSQRQKIKILGNAWLAVATVLFGQSHGKNPANNQDDLVGYSGSGFGYYDF